MQYNIHNCYRGGSHTASSAPPEGTITWILVSCHSDSIIHTCSSFTHTYKPHTHTHWPVAESWFAWLSFLSGLPVFTFLLSDLGLFTRYSDCLLPASTWIVFIGLWLFAACPDLLPGVRLCLCLVSTDLPCWYLTLYCLTILNKTANGSKLLWLLVTITMFSEEYKDLT